jgi:hypothetical protein
MRPSPFCGVLQQANAGVKNLHRTYDAAEVQGRKLMNFQDAAAHH